MSGGNVIDETKNVSTDHAITLSFQQNASLKNVQYTQFMIKGDFPSQSTDVAVRPSAGGVAVNYIASKFYVVGSSDNSNPIPQFSGSTGAPAMLMILLNDKEAKKTLYFCVLLANSASPSPGSEKLNALIQPSPAADQIINFDSLFNNQKTKFAIYTDQGATFILCVEPTNLPVNMMLAALKNPLTAPSFSNIPSKYSIVGSAATPGEWMECENVAIGADDVKTYALPITSNIITDMDSYTSYKTIILFITLFIAMVVFYATVPTVYVGLITTISKKFNISSLSTLVNVVDYGVSGVLLLLTFILMWVGITSEEKNATDVLLSGFIIFLIWLIGATIITMKKTDPNFPVITKTASQVGHRYH
jgi:hypothetical protein